MHLAQELVAYAERLTTAPDVYLKVRAALDDEKVSCPEVADIIATDPALTAALLRQANSAYYGYARKIERVDRAVSLVGLDHMHELVLDTSIASVFPGIAPQRMDMKRFWQDSLRRALLARTVAARIEGIDTERLFIAALLADLGHLVMYLAVPDLMAAVLDTQPARGESLADVERRMVGCDFTEVGAALTATWHLPVSYGVLIGTQLNPAAAGDYAPQAALLNVVGAVAARAGGATASDYPLHPTAAGLAGIEPEAVEATLTFVKPQLELLLTVFSPG